MRTAGDALPGDQFALGVGPQCIQIAGGFRQFEDAHRARDFTQPVRHLGQCCVIPIGLDETDEGTTDFREICRRGAHQHAHDLAGFLRALIVGAAVLTAAQVSNLIIERVLDRDQGTRDAHQIGLTGGPCAGGDIVDHLALFLHDGLGIFQTKYRQGVADPVQRLGLRNQLLDIAARTAQIQIQRVFYAQQILLDRRRHRVQQGTIAPGEAAARVFDLGFGRFDHQRGQVFLRHRLRTARRPQFVDQRQQHDRDVAMPALQAFQIVGQLHHAAHEHSQRLFPIAGVAAEQGDRHLLHFRSHHHRCSQLEHPQGTEDLMQAGDARIHRRSVIRRTGEAFKIDPRLAQGLVDLGLHPAERGLVDGVPQCRRHVLAPVGPRSAGLAWRKMLIPISLRVRRQAGSLKSATERRRSDASCARLPTDSAVWLAPCEVCAVMA